MKFLDYTTFKKRAKEICSFYNYFSQSHKYGEKIPTTQAEKKEFGEFMGKKRESEEKNHYDEMEDNLIDLGLWQKGEDKSEMGEGWWLIKSQYSGKRYILWLYPWKIPPSDEIVDNDSNEKWDEEEYVEGLVYYYATIHLGGNLSIRQYQTKHTNYNGGYPWFDGIGWGTSSDKWDAIYLGKNGGQLPTPHPPMLNWYGRKF